MTEETHNHDPKVCAAQHEQIAEALRRVEQSLEDHINEVHVTLNQRDDQAMALIGELADAFLGPRQGRLFDGERDHSRGMTYRIHELSEWQRRVDAKLRNGGLPAKLSPRDRATITVAGLGALAAVVTQMIEVIGAAP